MEFKKLGNGLYGFDVDNDNKLNTVHTHSSFHHLVFTTVRSNKKYFSNTEVEEAERARILQGKMGWPSDAQYKKLLSEHGNSIINVPVTAEDVTRANEIYGGTAEQLIVGKTVRRRTTNKYLELRYHQH